MRWRTLIFNRYGKGAIKWITSLHILKLHY